MSRITDAEWPIMKVLWGKETATAAEIVKRVTSEKDTNMRTVKTLLRRLIDKKAVTFAVDKNDKRIYHYKAVISEEEGLRLKSDELVPLVYDSAASLLTHFVSSSKLSKDEIERLQKLLDEKHSNNS